MVFLKILPFLLLEPGLMMKSVVSSDKFGEFHSNFISRVKLENVTDGIMGCFLYGRPTNTSVLLANYCRSLQVSVRIKADDLARKVFVRFRSDGEGLAWTSLHRWEREIFLIDQTV